MKFSVLLSNEEILAELGHRLAVARIRSRITQKELAAKAGISASTYRRLENGAGLGSVEAFVAVLRALRIVDRLEIVLPPDRPSPREIFEQESRRKPLPRRVRKAREPKADANATWGDGVPVGRPAKRKGGAE
jgi:transcriptional regulator with XRE-family HTH domain